MLRTSEIENNIFEDVDSMFLHETNVKSRSDKVYRIVRILHDILKTAKKAKRSRVTCASPDMNRLA